MENIRDSWEEKKRERDNRPRTELLPSPTSPREETRLDLISFSFPRKEKAANRKLPDQYCLGNLPNRSLPSPKIK